MNTYKTLTKAKSLRKEEIEEEKEEVKNSVIRRKSDKSDDTAVEVKINSTNFDSNNSKVEVSINKIEIEDSTYSDSSRKIINDPKIEVNKIEEIKVEEVKIENNSR